MDHISVIGAGLAGCEAASRISAAGIHVKLYEMKPEKRSPAHSSDGFAELVCSNSLKASRVNSAAGLLKHEMRRLGSICLEAAAACEVPAGGALAVDRDEFSRLVTQRILTDGNIEVVHGEVTQLPDEGITVIATGPLTSDGFAETIRGLCGDSLSFYDAAAPIVTYESVDMTRAFTASRYGRGGDCDYINCPMNKAEYEEFYAALVSAERAFVHEFDVYEGCMPVEVLASRGEDAMRFGPLKPVGLRDPSTGKRPWAVLQLRRENSAGTLLNLVGFQTNLKFGEQKRVFSMIPALRNAEFVRYGVMHRNSFINSPKLLNRDYSLRERPNVFFAGQITGVEGYMESAGSGILAGINAARRFKNEEPFVLEPTSMLGALTAYICDETVKDFQPMGANFGILPPLSERIRDKQERYMAYARRSPLF